MQKPNIIKSSLFHMDEGDVLHLLFTDELYTSPTITLNSVSEDGDDNMYSVPDAPVALDASDITSTSFSANVNLMENTLGFYLDVATDSVFTAFIAGYNNKDIGLVDTYPVVGLSDITTYYTRFRGYNDYGTGQSSNVITTLTDIENVVDADGNVYTYVTIGTQQWLIESLKTTKYIDGTVIPNLTLDADWVAENGTAGHDGAYCYQENDINNKVPYGALYNWYAVNNAKGLAPTGWRIPDDADMTTLFNYVDILTGARKLKEIGLDHWLAGTGTDDYGFRAVGNGLRYDDGFFAELKFSFWIWSSDQESATEANSAYIDDPEIRIIFTNGLLKRTGLAIRCMRDVTP